MVTPLNSQAIHFTYVEFYLDGVLLSTFYPDSTGTATWNWDTATFKGKLVKIIAYDASGEAIAKEFHVTIALPGTQPTDAANHPTQPGASGNSIDQFVNFLVNAMRVIPTPIAVSIPYLLLLLLLIIIGLLYAQSLREAREARRLRLALRRAKQLAEEKEGFIELASHYLRTPLTLIRGGADFFTVTKPAVDPTTFKNLISAIDAFGIEIESLLSNASNDQRLQTIKGASDLPAAHPIWAMPLFWLPLILETLLLAGINYLLVRADKIELATGVLTQSAAFAAMAIGLYMVLRWRTTSRRDTALAKQQETQQTAIDEARNNLIYQAAAILAQKLQAIVQMAPQLPEGQAKQFLQDGCMRIGEVLKRFRATAMVIPPVTTMPFASFSFSALLTQAKNAVGKAAETKRIQITQATADAMLASQQPAWVVQALSSVLDNAIAYSPEDSQIEVGAQVQDDQAIITIQDHGAGIPEDKIAELLQPFSKAEGPLQFDHPGLGLSLYLDRLLLTNLSGSIRIASRLNQGTKVEISFPVQTA